MPDVTQICLTLLEHIESGDDAELSRVVAQVREDGIEVGSDGAAVLEVAVETGRLETVERLLPLGVPWHVRVIDTIANVAHGMAWHALRLGHGRIAVRLLEEGFWGGSGLRGDDVWKAIGEDLMSWEALRPEQLEPLIPMAQSYSSLLLSPAIRAGRTDVVEYLLAEGLRPARDFHTVGDHPLMVAALTGAVGLIPLLVQHGAPVNARDRNGHTPLHRLLRATEIDEAERAPALVEMLRQLAVPQMRTRVGLDAYRIAEELGLENSLALLHEHGLSYGPRQSREARAELVLDVCLHYGKADAFVYRIGLPDSPFLTGGDYMGSGPTGGVEAEAVFVRMCEEGSRMQWFRPFLNKLLQGHEFAFADLMRFEDRFSLYRFADTSNWDAR